MSKTKQKYNRGLSLVEVIIGSAVVLMVITATVTAYNVYINYALSNQNNTVANYLLEEGVEAMMFLRDSSWSSNIVVLNSTTDYYLFFDGSKWLTTTTPQYIDGNFVRSILVAHVTRDANDDIAVAGSDDPNTKKITVTVSYWQGHATTTKSLSTYITNINGS